MSAPDLRDPCRDRADYRASWSARPDELVAAQRRILAATRELDGWLLDRDTLKLVEIAYFCGDLMLEVGTWAGRSVVVQLLGALARRQRRERPRFVGLDCAPEAIDATYRTLAGHGLARDAALYRGSLPELVREHAVAPTMVFVDGGHRFEEVAADLAALDEILTAGVPVFGHDYVNAENDRGEYGVRRAFDAWEARGAAEFCGLFGCGALFVTASRDRSRATPPTDRESFEALRHDLRQRHDVVSRFGGEQFSPLRAGFAPQPVRFALATGYGAETMRVAGRDATVEWIRSPAVLLVENRGAAREVVLRIALGSAGAPCRVALEVNGETQARVFDVAAALWQGEATRAEWPFRLSLGDNVLRLLADDPPTPLADGRPVSWQVLGEARIEAA